MNLKYFLLACKQIFIFIYAGASLVAQMVRNPPAMQVGSIHGLGRSPGKGNDYPLQY